MGLVTHTINITFRDGDGQTSTRTWDVYNTVAVTDMPLLANALVALITPVITGGIVSVDYVISLTPPSLTISNLSDVQELWAIAARTTSGFLRRFGIPTIDEAKVFVPGSREADSEDADVAALENAMRNGIDLSGAGGSGLVRFSDNHGTSLTSLEYSREEFSK